MSRNLAAVGFVALLALGVVGALAPVFSGGDQFGAPPDQLVQFDEQATAEFNDAVATRQNRDHALVVVAIALGLTGVIVVGVGHFEDRSRRSD